MFLFLLTWQVLFFKKKKRERESEEPKSEENKDQSRAYKMAAGIMLFVALLRKVSDPKSAEVVRGYCASYS